MAEVGAAVWASSPSASSCLPAHCRCCSVGVPHWVLRTPGALPAETLHAPSCHRRHLPGPGHDAGHQVCGGGRRVGTWSNFLTAPLWGPLRPSCPGVPEEAPCSAGVSEGWPCGPSLLLPGTLSRSPWDGLRTASCALPTSPQKLPGGRVQDFRVGVPGALRLHPESWGRAPMGPQALARGCRWAVGNQKSGLCPQADLSCSQSLAYSAVWPWASLSASPNLLGHL